MSANTLVDGGTTITLPDDLSWVDEFSWLPTSQQKEFGFDGSLIVEESAVLAGRPITLEGSRDHAWIDRVTLQAMYALAAVTHETPMVLTLFDGRTFNVLFRHDSQLAVEGKPMIDFVPLVDGDFYIPTFRFLQV